MNCCVCATFEKLYSYACGLMPVTLSAPMGESLLFCHTHSTWRVSEKVAVPGSLEQGDSFHRRITPPL